ncbi:SLAIN motif-containing protein-like isoform X2 [Paramormyrops kingsleyae]|nr:SLAIN motif-containing protein-like isoform X2 [Paramormyrops kingsleyae]XP_023672198.1 SLAIN motif-containing protein-like isoform X2 [Paramormyrops kingsleyae]XP_023672199.1 SLAIN motif-containing protein-like isoform X2 [Paramormyrops kingsleyae]XP_023672200.1 SLAIN motif-containing protein-like isoform X2 [Paramormyrops kingsleyae]XP_023672201.1 SLAIN motif-containing protein-like isoform X2 [Paramormyrops kingsleyae]XP_023672203.1 SLAIN motif-containing protein-like isoform X2 [Paramor
MVVPENGTAVQQADNGESSSLGETPQAGFGTEQDTDGKELEEVRKLQELVRRLEVQNQTLRNRGGRANSNLRAASNINARTPTEEVTTSPLVLEDHVKLGSRGLEPSPRPDSNSSSNDSSRDVSPLPDTCRLEDEEEGAHEGHLLGGGYMAIPCSRTSGETLCRTVDTVGHETPGGADTGANLSALDEVEVLNLEECDEMEEEDSWLYVSPKKQVLAEERPESPLKWCRKVLDHPSPETEVACRMLINRLDQTTRWRNIYSSPSQTVGPASESGPGTALLSPGYHKTTNKTLLTCGSSGHMGTHSALSSQSSIDSELSTSDDSISMGYKLQDLTDVQIMARLQEESLRQDYASSSASVSRRSSSASLQSLRRGTYSDQEFDSYSLEDEEDGCFSLPQRLHRYSPSPLSSPRCQSPNTLAEYSRLSAQRTRTPRRSLQGPGSELLAFAQTEDELRHSMPNLAPRTSLRSLEAVRNSRSMEANLQSPGSRMSRLPHSSSIGVSSTRLRSNGQSPLSLRAPVKALSPVGTMTGVRQPQRAHTVTQEGPLGGAHRGQSPGPSNGGASSATRLTTVTNRSAPGRARSSLGGSGAASRGRLAQPTRRSLGLTKSCRPVADESWKDGCY